MKKDNISKPPFADKCVTHHYACDCREAKFRELLEDVIHAHIDLGSANYNDCENSPCMWCQEAKLLINYKQGV